ncbi:MAG TPA: nuclear transport factor 2 family protein [Burkholderiaceae bacterium]|nr:nuclear transport factor 2 family protein [Burkholderiaceae bacterium]
MLRLASAWLAIAIVALTACTRSDPERELRTAVAAMAQAIEQREPAVFLDSVSDDFARESGALGKQDVKRLLAAAYLRNEKISVDTVVTDVRVDGDRAHAKVRVLATGGAGLLPERGQSWVFDSVWRRESGRWKVYNAEWSEAQ